MTEADKTWCGGYCDKHALMEGYLEDAKGKVSMRIFGIAIGIVVLVFGAVFAIQSKTSDSVASIDKNQALVQQSQQRMEKTLDKIQQAQERELRWRNRRDRPSPP
ncbi:hypothetical protein LCGC14_2049000 [marine sediment metagenome]|uniref:Uncharacterized protein n=1 Tax=marine sediment metagenome TaxID=412755 RepID=A0A0F9EPJ0_9ZZZZ